MIDRETLCDLDAEQALCGIALTDNAAADEALAAVRPEAFYRDAHERIWTAVAALRGRRAGCDVLTVADALQGAGDEQRVPAPYLRQLAEAAPGARGVLQFAEMVREAHLRRLMVRAAKDAMQAAADPERDIAAVLAAVTEGLRGVAEATATGDGPERLSELIVPAFREVEAVYEGTVAPGIPTGIALLDAMLGGGLHRGEATVLGGRPSVGKSSLAQQIATHIASTAGHVLFASAEMPKRTVAMRGLSARSGVDAKRFRYPGSWPSQAIQGDDWPKLSSAIGWIGENCQRLWVDDSSRDMDEIGAQARRLHAREPLTLVVVDHLQHLRTPNDARENRTHAIGRMATDCKELAVALDVAVLVLSQLRRPAPGEDRKPRLSELRESGEIEQVADVALLLHRPADEVPPPLCEVECAIAKNRNGELGALTLWHERATGRWSDQTRIGRTARPVAGGESA